MPHALTRSLDRSATLFLIVVAAFGVLIPLSNLLLPAGSMFQVPTYARGYTFGVAGYLDRLQDDGKIEMHVLPQPQLWQILHEAKCELLEVREDTAAGDRFIISNTILARKR